MTVDALIKPAPISQAEALTTAFSHIGEGETEWRSDGLRDFFLYRDLGVAAATNGQVIAQLVKANLPRKRARAGTATRPNFISSSC